ncbi:MAG: hypothetical protein RL065_1949 [Bacteroidota bacterium]|jgi:uncharacterized protein (TIGR01777 family)
MKKIIIAGGSGFLGKSIIHHFDENEFEFVILSREYFDTHKKNCVVKLWDGKNIGDWKSELEGAVAVINLSGKSINCRYTDENKRLILSSRIDSTNAIGKAIEQCLNPPEVWMNASAATLYKYTETKNHDETSVEFNDDFSSNVCMEWERAFDNFKLKKTRKIILRISIVLGKNEGAFSRLASITKLGLGGKQGNGKQFVSWIHIDDYCRAIHFFIKNKLTKGIYNISTDNPVTNSDLMKTFRKKYHVPIGLPAPEFLLKISMKLIGTEPELILKSRRVVPKKMLGEGFTFLHPTIDSAIENLI